MESSRPLLFPPAHRQWRAPTPLRYGRTWRSVTAAMLLLIAACQDPPRDALQGRTGGLDQAETGCVLRLLNGCHHDAARFDLALGWDRRAAEALVDWRDGPDGQCGTADDRPFTSLDQVDALPHVGPAALTRLLEALVGEGCTERQCAGVAGGVTAGVVLSAREAHDVIDFVTRGDAAALQTVPGIGPTTAARLIERRPATLAALDEVPGVGPSLITTLRDETDRRWCTRPMARCGCTPPSPAAEAVALLQDPNWPPSQRFRRLLGAEGYERLARAFAPDIRQAIAAGTAVEEALTAALDQSVFTRPFEHLGPSLPDPGASHPDWDAAADGLILTLGVTDLANGPVGVSFDELVRWNEPEYLVDVARWRSGQVYAEPLDHAWILSGSVLGIPAWVTLARGGGSPPVVELDLAL